MSKNRRLKRISFLSLALILFLVPGLLTANETPEEGTVEEKLVYKFNMKDDIMPGMWRQTQQSFQEAVELNADHIIIHMNTYGGMVQVADSIRTRIMNSRIPVTVFVDNNAISAGALIAIAAGEIYMRPGGSMGAATVVDASGAEAPDKHQSFMRAVMRTTAESHGRDTIITDNDTTLKWRRDPAIAEAMVDPRLEIPGIVEAGQVLTFSAEEAMENNYSEGLAGSVEEVLLKSGIENYEIVEYQPTGLERFIGFLISPIVQGVLIMIIIGGLYFELQTPGIGFPAGAAIAAAILYFAPLYIEGIAQNWEIVIFVAGIILLAVEIFAIPGFGVAGIAGLVMMVTGLSLSMVDSVVFEFEGAGARAVVRAIFLVVFSSFIALSFSIYMSRRLLTTSLFSHLVLDSKQEKEEGYIGVDYHYRDIVGSTGKAYTSLRPSGKVEVEGELYDAKSLVGFIEKGEEVKVINFETGQIYVVKDEE